MRFTLRVIGNLELSVSQPERVLPITSRKSRALLALLASSPRRRINRSDAASLLWAGDDPKTRLNLRQELSVLRRALGGHASQFFSATDDEIALTDAVDTDLAQLAAATKADDVLTLSAAMDVVRGPFGADLDLACDNFQRWLSEERAAARHLAVSVGDRLVRTLAEKGRHKEALDRALALHALEPLREETHRLVLREEAIVSGRASAMARYEQFRTLLRDELAVQPERETQRLLDTFRAQKSSEPAAATQATKQAPIAAPPKGSGLWRFPADLRLSGALAIALMAAAVFLFNPRIFFKPDVKPSATTAEALPAPATYNEQGDGKVSLAILPFTLQSGSEALAPFAAEFNMSVKRVFLLHRRHAVIDTPRELPPAGRMAQLGRALHARYIMSGYIQQQPQGRVHVFVEVWDTETGSAISGRSIVREGTDLAVTLRQLTSETALSTIGAIALHWATKFADEDMSVQALLARAGAHAIRSQYSDRAPNERDVWKRILALAPDNELALSHLVGQIAQTVARNQSPDVKADLAELAVLLDRLRHIAPESAHAEFIRGLTAKVSRDHEVAARHFERVLELWPGHLQAGVQLAHIGAFLGRVEEGVAWFDRWVDQKTVTVQTIDNAYIAGEVALVARRYADAARWLALAVQQNPKIGRVQALYAAALELAGREAEATQAATEAHRQAPNYSPQVMALRGSNRHGETAPAFASERDRYVEAYRAALGRAVAATRTEASTPIESR
ncbi:bacterial transcriptional activator domain protein [Variibacter gotjawalensis]|uniref:Bacterial transcriptional activator domain protein n=1 Tax=Variibacter gotjawalensis TaxID=1333996 RepID=A0A0S3PYQ3_9BRAD|nr:BTAD domain-containing putative transcriptional regulator [Variibacter gotjawalensis]NIK46900.1 DNA-binding SARP family transcriptional activator/TolB-like protein [Variibacter gotjawalensis]RZS48804.1 DNA-binding SARP family transcriptional activator [Variibacter gotjawalensis]BAT61063.1 bacterial transcriptional activator domain protein [Variibacter gotjawalensis]